MSHPVHDDETPAVRLELVRAVLAATPDPLDVPFDVDFRPLDADQHVEAWRRFASLARDGRLHPELIVYLHIPFCSQVCSYCLLSATRTPGNASIDAYVQAVQREIQIYAPILESLSISALHVGGGTPTLLKAEQLDALLGTVRRAFNTTPAFHAGVEAHPATVTPDKLAAIKRHGVSRISFGVESFTDDVLARAGRKSQTLERVQSAVRLTLEAGIKDINLDLLAGLPGETLASFSDSVRKAIALGANSLSVNRYIAENSPLASFGYAPTSAEDRLADEMLLLADRIIREERPPTLPTDALEEAAYGAQYIWDETGEAPSYFQQDMVGPASVLTLGHGALGHLHCGDFYTTAGTHHDYVRALNEGRPPPVLVSPVSRRFEMAFFFADQATRGTLTEQAFVRVFRTDPQRAFGASLEFLVNEGRLKRSDHGWRKPADRRFQVTHLMAFLLFSVKELRQKLGALGQASSPVGRGMTAGGKNGVLLQRLGHGGPAQEFAAMPNPDQLLAALASTGGRTRITVPLDIMPPLGLDPLRAREAGLVELVLGGLDPDSFSSTSLSTVASGFRAAGIDVLVLLPALEACQAPEKFRELAQAGVSGVMLEGANLPVEAAEQLMNAATRARIRVEVLGTDAQSFRHQYEDITAELPPSLFWCRIAIRAQYHTRRDVEGALVQL